MNEPELWQVATRKHQTGDLAGAEALYRQLLQADPKHADALHVLGLVLSQTGRPDEALVLIRQAMALRPEQPTYVNNLGEVLRQQGQFGEAEACFRQALALAPQFPEAHFNLGNALKSQGRYEEALAAYQQAVRLRPGYAKVHFNLANTLREFGLVKAAIESYRQALALRPNWAEARLNLGVAHAELAEHDAAIACYRRAAELDPGLDVDGDLGNAYLDQGRIEEAAACYGREIARHPSNWPRQLKLDALADPIPADNDSIDNYRSRLAVTLDRWAAGPRPPLNLGTLHTSGAEPPMALAYQGRDDRRLKERWAALFAGAFPELPLRPNTGRPHVGVVVTHGHEGVFFKCLGGLVDRLPGPDLKVTVICSRSGRNILRQWLRHPDLDYLLLPERVDQAAETIAQGAFDLLYYWEVGTDSTNYFLPFARLAPVQCAGWGWPVTSGISTIDYFMSNELLEPPGGDAHYSERLVRLRRLPTYYRRPTMPARPKRREELGLDPTAHVYLCTQNLRKYHPDFDPLIAGVLRADPLGRFVLLADGRPLLTERLRQRLCSNLGDVSNRLQVLTRLSEPDYLNLIAVADVVLDTPHYGGGANTVYDAIAAGTPVVTLPGAFHRGRWTFAANTTMGLTDLIAMSANEYVQTAVRITSEPDYCRELQARLRGAGATLFEDTGAVDEIKQLIAQTIEKNRGRPQPTPSVAALETGHLR